MRITLAVAFMLAAGSAIAAPASSTNGAKRHEPRSKGSVVKPGTKQGAERSSPTASRAGKAGEKAEPAAQSAVSGGESAPVRDAKTEGIEKEAAAARQDADRRMQERDRKLSRTLKSICKGC